VTSGVVSRIEVTAYVHGSSELLGMQIDAAINSGNSGGPACNGAGECVGIAFQVHGLPQFWRSLRYDACQEQELRPTVPAPARVAAPARVSAAELPGCSGLAKAAAYNGSERYKGRKLYE